MDVFLIKSGVIQNCISAESTAAAQTAYPTFTVVQRTGSNTVYGVGDLYSGSVFSFSTRPSISAATDSTGAWTPNRSYAVGDRAVSPTGRSIVCWRAHTSTSTYNIIYWTYPGDRNESIVDFTLCPDGNINTAEPTVGRILYPTDETQYNDYVIRNGRARTVDNYAGSASYYTLMLPDDTDKVKHIWAIYEVPDYLTYGNIVGCTLVLPSSISTTQYRWLGDGSESRAGVHWQLYSQIAIGDQSGQASTGWSVGDYNAIYDIKFTGVIAARPASGITRTTATLFNPFSTTAGSKIVTISHASHGAGVGDYVTFSNSSSVGGLTLNGTFQVAAIAGQADQSGNYAIIASAKATSSVSNAGGTTVSAVYQTPGLPSDYITISNVSASGTGAGDTTTQLIRPGMQISGEVSVIADSTASTSLSIPGFFGNTLTVGMFITGLNVPTEETKVTAVSYNGGVTTVLLNNALTAGTQTRFAFSYIYGGTWYCSANAAASNTGSNTTLGTGLGGNDWFRSVLHLPILIQSQVSGTPGREGVYRLNQVNLAAAAKVTGFVNIYGELKGAPIIAQGKRIRVDIIIDPNTGQQSGYLNGILAVQTRNGQAAAFTSSYGILESPSSESRTLEFGISAHLPDFYTSNSNALPTHYPAGYTGLGILTPGDWQLWNTVNVSYGASGAVEISVNPYIECISDAIYMTLSSTTAKPVTYYPQLMAKATIKCKVPFRSVRFGTPGTTEEVGIWVYTNGSGNRVNTISGTDAGGYGGMVVQAVNSQYSIA